MLNIYWRVLEVKSTHWPWRQMARPSLMSPLRSYVTLCVRAYTVHFFCFFLRTAYYYYFSLYFFNWFLLIKKININLMFRICRMSRDVQLFFFINYKLSVILTYKSSLLWVDHNVAIKYRLDKTNNAYVGMISIV